MSTRFKRFNFLFSAVVLLTACEEAIVHDLSEERANQVKLELAEAGIAAKKVKGAEGWALTVSNEYVNAALQTLAAKRVIKEPEPAGDENSTGFVRSKQERMRAMERQLAADIQRTLEAVPGVLEARVHLHTEAAEEFSLKSNAQRASASVLLITENKYHTAESAVQRLVSGASGVAAEKITVVVTLERSESGTPYQLAAAVAVPTAAPKSEQLRSLFSSQSLLVVAFLLLLSLVAVRRRRLQSQARQCAMKALSQVTKQTEMQEVASSPEKLNGIGAHDSNFFSALHLNQREVF